MYHSTIVNVLIILVIAFGFYLTHNELLIMALLLLQHPPVDDSQFFQGDEVEGQNPMGFIWDETEQQ